MSGCLYIVGTPIGNLGDLSDRARQTISDCKVVACEDSRRLAKLINYLALDMPKVIVIESHRERSGAKAVVEHLAGGHDVALVTDAGMPTISDPGSIVVDEVVEASHRVDVVPGPTALSSAVALSGFDAKRLLFLGFIDKKGSSRTADLKLVSEFDGVAVMYESSKRISSTLADLAEACSQERQVVVARELTKIYQSVYRGSLQDVADQLADTVLKGELTVVVGPTQGAEEVDDSEITELLSEKVDQGISTRDAVAQISEELAVPKNRVYKLAKGKI